MRTPATLVVSVPLALTLVGAPATANARPAAPPRSATAPAARAAVSDPQGTGLSGRVTDPEGRPLAGATVALPELARRTETDDAGRFNLPDVPAGSHRVVVTRPGYAARALDADAGGRVDVVLEPDPFVLQGITVTASGSPTTESASPLPASSLGPDQLRREHGVSLAHTLEGLAGVHTLSTGGQVGKPVIRGLTGSRVRVLEDGLPLEDYAWSGEDGPSVDARLARRVELVRGPASVLYGSDALGGVVNVIPPEMPDGLGREPFRRQGAEVYAASNNLETGGTVWAEGARGRIGWRFTGVGRFSGNMHTPNGELENTAFGSFSGEGAIGTHGDWGSGELRVSHYGGEFRLLEAEGPGVGPGGAPLEEEGPERKTADERVELSARFPRAGHVAETKLMWQRHWLSELADEPGVGATPGQEVTVFDLTLNTLTAEALLRHRAGDRLRGVVGLTGSVQGNATAGAVPVIPGATTLNAGVFALETLEAGPVSFQAGGRYDARAVDADARGAVPATSVSYTALTGSVGAVLSPGAGIRLSANVGRAWRAPTLFELFADGPRLGEARYEIGDEGLVPETALDLDAGLRWDAGPATLDMSVFHNRVDDFIHLIATGDTIDGLAAYEHRQVDAVLEGAEAQAGLRAASWLDLRGRVDFVRGTDVVDDVPLPWIPPLHGDAGADVHLGDLGWARGADLGFTVESVARQDRLSTFDTPTAAYTLLHLSGGVDTAWHGHPFRVDLRVRNALDTAYRDFLSRYKGFALNPGRNIVVRVSADL